MKKFALVLILVALIGLTGCNMPQGVKGALYSAQITSAETVKDVEAGKVPFGEVENETTEAQIARLQSQVNILVRTLDQIDKNLTTVVEYVRGKKENE